MKMLTGKDYPHLCEKCQSAIDHCYDMLQIDSTIMTGSYSYQDDHEAPCNLAYDRSMLCGGQECANKPIVRYKGISGTQKEIDQVKELEKLYNKAVENNDLSLVFEGRSYRVDYIEYTLKSWGIKK